MIKVALAQCCSKRYDKESNLMKAEDLIIKAHNNGANIILFPEMFTTGYLIKTRINELSECANGKISQYFSNLAKKYDIAIVYGFPQKIENQNCFYNSACFIDKDGSIRAIYNKTHLFGDEDRSLFKEGDKIFSFETSFGCKMSLLICYDIEFPETARLAALDGAKIICVISANMFPYEDYHVTYLKARAMENSVFTCYVNCVGKEDQFIFCGKSCVFSPTGKQIVCGSTEKEELLFADVEIKQTLSNDPCLRYLENRRTDIYSKLL